MNGLLRSCESISSISKIQTWTRPLQLHTIVWYYNLLISETYIDIFICCSNTEFWLVAYIYSTYMVRAFMFSQFFFFFFFLLISLTSTILGKYCMLSVVLKHEKQWEIWIWFRWVFDEYHVHFCWCEIWCETLCLLYLRKSFLNPCVTSWE